MGENNVKWISVKERLPNDNKDYLVLNKYHEIFISAFLPSMKEFCSSSITHWMELPALPQDPIDIAEAMNYRPEY